MPLTTARLLDLEEAGLWPDFHSKFINYWQESLAESLPREYEARVGEQVNLYEYEEPIRRFGPDVAVLVRPGESPFRRAASTTHDSGGVALLEPVTVPLAEIHEEVRQPFLEIIHRPDRSLVTVLELLSPSNKAEPGRARYLAKRRSLLESPVHLVELDLLQGGRRLPFGAPLPVGDFYCMISRLELRYDCLVYAGRYGEAFPHWPVPLRAPDPDVSLDYQALFELTFTRGRYERSLERG